MRNFGVFLRICIFSFFFVITFYISAFAAPGLSAQSAILINADNQEILAEYNANEKLGMASTTKIMTAIVAIENGSLDETFEIPKAAVGIEGSSLYLKEGESMTLKDLIIGLMLRSANDAAEAIAIIVGGSVENFVAMMNSKASELGLTSTHFCNPHGLSADEHYTTAKELALIASYALKNDTFRSICSMKSATIAEKDSIRYISNHNKMLSLYSGTYGVKTGFTKATGRCLVSAAEKDGVRLIAVTLNAPDDWNDHIALFNYGFSTVESVTLATANQIIATLPVIGGIENSVSVCVKNDITVCIKRNRNSIVERIELNRPKFAPVYQGDVVGKIVYSIDGVEIASAPLCATKHIEALPKNKNFFNKLFNRG